MGLNANALRRDFPLLAAPDAPVFFDNACMTLKPRSVIDATTRYYAETPFCAGRSVYAGARAVGDLVTDARAALARLLGARPERVVWTKNATEALNLIARAFPFERGDVVLTTDKEHNSNLVPWQLAARERGIRHEVVATREDGGVDVDALTARLARGDVKLVSLAHASNLDGSLNPVEDVVAAAHAHGARVLVDGAQAAAHHPVDLARLGADYYAVSLHKMLGPTGVGALVAGSQDALDALGPFIVGGDTVADVTVDSFRLLEAPARFEAGLQNYAGLAAVPPAIEYLERVGLAAIEAHEAALTERLDAGLRDVPGVTILGPEAGKRGGITSFTTDFLDPHEMAILLDDKHGIWVRSGDHCVHAWFNKHAVGGSTRASLYLYNTVEEVDRFTGAVAAIARTIRG